MASPQVENGFLKISVEFWEAWMRTRISGCEDMVLKAIVRKTWGFKKRADRISNSQLCKMTGMGKVAVCKAVARLVDRKIVTKNGNTSPPTYSIQKNYDVWGLLPKKVTVTKNGNSVTNIGNKSLPILVPTIDNTKDTYQKKRRNKKMFPTTSIEIALVRFFIAQIRRNNPEFKTPNEQAWARHIDLMLRVDKRTPEKIREIITWAQRDRFWKSNVMCAESLRAQYDRLVVQAKESPARMTDQEVIDAIDQEFGGKHQ